MTPTAAGFVGTGTSLSVGNTERLVAGAPASDSNKGYAVGIRTKQCKRRVHTNTVV